MSVLILFLIIFLVIFFMFFLSWTFFRFLPFILLLWLIWWIVSLFRKPKKKNKTFIYYQVFPDDPFQKNRNPENEKTPQLRAPREDSIDAEYTERESTDD